MSENNTTVTSNNSYSQALFELASENYVLLEVEEQAIAILKLIKDSSEFSDLIKNPHEIQLIDNISVKVSIEKI